jgi:hypothetical protein
MLSVMMLSVMMPSVMMLSAMMPSVMMLSVTSSFRNIDVESFINVNEFKSTLEDYNATTKLFEMLPNHVKKCQKSN